MEVIDLSERDEDENDENNLTECTERRKEILTGIGNKRVLEALQTYPWHELETDVQADEEKGQTQKEDTDSQQVGGDFEDLMSKLSTFKQASDNLPRNERYAFAEQIALSFYSAMGGEEEEPE